MPRPKGSRNAATATRKVDLAARLRARLADRAEHVSMRELARAAEVSLPTLVHHFGDRTGLVEALMADQLEGGRQPLAVAATPSGPFARSVGDLLKHAAAGFRYGGLTDAHAVGLAEGLKHPVLGPAYLRNALEPTLAAFAARLAAHQAAGEMRATCDPRHAALLLLGPLVIAFLHQDALGGAAASPIDMRRLIADIRDSFVGSHAAG